MSGLFGTSWLSSLRKSTASVKRSRRRLLLESLEDRRVLAVSYYVNLDWAGTASGTDPDGSGPASNFGTLSFATVPDAISAANGLGGGSGVVTINIQQAASAPTVYPITQQQIITEDMNIVGAGAANTSLEIQFNALAADDTSGAFLVQPGVTLNVSDITLDGNYDAGWKVWKYFLHRGSGTFNNVAFKDVQYDATGGPATLPRNFQGIGVAVVGNGTTVDILNSTFSNMGRAGAIYIGNVAGTFSGNTYTGKGSSYVGNTLVSYHLDYAVDIDGEANVTVTRNTITGNLGVGADQFGVGDIDSAAVLISTLKGPNTVANVTENFLNGNTVGVWVGYNAATEDASNVTIYNNDLSGNDGAIVSTDPDVFVQASGNYFGETPNNAQWGNYDVYNNTYGSVDFTPFLNLGIDTDTDTKGFQGNFSELNVTVLGEQVAPVGADGRIKEALALLDTTQSPTSAGVIKIYRGTYDWSTYPLVPIDDVLYIEPQQLLIDKNVTFQGLDPATTTISPSSSFGTGDGNSGDAAGWFVVPSSYTVNVNNLTFDGAGRPIWQAFRYLGTGDLNNVRFTDIAYSSTRTSPFTEAAVAVLGTSGSVDITNSSFTYSNVGVYVNNTNASVTTSTMDGNAFDVVINGTASGDTVTVTPTSVANNGTATVTIDGTVTTLLYYGQGGADAFNVTPSATTQFFLDGGAGSDLLDFSSYNSAGLTTTLSATGPIDGFEGTATATGVSTVNFTNVNAFRGSSGTNDTFVMDIPGQPSHWDIGGNVSGYGPFGGTPSVSLSNSLSNSGVLIINSATVGLTGNNSAIGRLTGANPVAASGSELGLPWIGFENLTGAAAADDRFDFRAGASVSGTVNGRGSGVQGDSLDYRDYTTPVTVNLGAGSATGTGGIAAGTGGDLGSSIENVFGGNAADTITGDQDANILGDGHGSDLLDGGAVSNVSGNDTFRLEPGANEDGTGDSADVITDLNGSDTVDFRFADYGVVFDMDLLNVDQDVFVAVTGTQTVRLGTLTGQDPLGSSPFENFMGSQYNDTINLDPLVVDGNLPPGGPPTVRSVHGNSPPGAPVGGGSEGPIPPGDTWNFDAKGLPLFDSGFSISLGGLAAVTYESIETIKSSNNPPRIIDDGDDDFTEFPTWATASIAPTVHWNQVYNQGGLNNDYRYNHADTTSGSVKDTHYAEWSFYGVTPGRYRVAVSYPDPALSPQPSSLASDAQFTIHDDDRLIARVDVDQRVLASSYTDAGVPWHELGIFTIRSRTLMVELKDNANGIVLADAVRIERVNDLGEGAASTPASTGGELTVLQGSQMLRDGASVLSLTTSINNPTMQNYIIRNDGAGDLTVSNIELAMQGGRPNNYTLTIPTMPLTLAAGSTAVFSVQLDATTANAQGDFPAQLRIFSNDFDENVVMSQGSTGIPYPANPALDVDPFTVQIRGLVTDYSIVDNSSLSGFVTTGTWQGSATALGYNNNQLSTVADGSGETATWTFTNLPAGTYRVAATWQPTTNTPTVTNAPFAVSVNGGASTTISVNQALAPSTFTAQGVGWQDLGSPVVLANATNSISVTLTDNAPFLGGTRYVIADAVRVERLFSDASTVPPFVTSEPDISVSVGGTDVVDDTTVVDYGTAYGGSTAASLTKTFVVSNVGGANLILSQPIQVPAGYAVMSLAGVSPPDGMTSVTVAPGSSVELVIRMDTGLPGDLDGTVWITNNDPDENIFNFDVTGSIRSSQIVDNQDAAPDLVNGIAGFTPGSFTLFTGNDQGFNKRIHSVTAGAGSPAQWVFPGLTPGRNYLVSATWTEGGNRPTNAQYTLTTATSATVSVNQQLRPNQREANGHVFNDLGVVTAGPTGVLTVSLSSSVGTGTIVADAIRVLALEQPELELFQGSTLILDEVTQVDFGTTPVGTSVDRSFSISNLGMRPMAVGTPELPPGYSLVGSFPSSVPAGGSAAFTLRLTAAAAGAFLGVLRFPADEANENPFEVRIKGNVVNTSTDTIIDNTVDVAPSFVVTGAFTAFGNQGRNNTVHAATSYNPTPSVATYTFSGLTANTVYRVSATWSTALNRATNSPFTISGVVGGPYQQLVNQELAPADYNADGSLWQDLGGPFTTSGTSLTVSLTNVGANEYVVADAIRIEPLSAQSVIRLFDSSGSELRNGGSYQFVGTAVGVPVDATFTVLNAGNSTLTLDAAALADSLLQAPEFALQTALGSSSLAPGASTTFTVRMVAPFADAPATTIVLGNNDADANPFLLTLTGTVVAPTQLIDDGDFGNGYTESGPNLPIQVITNSGGYSGDFRQIAANSNNTALYTFVGLTPNTSYRVGATWVASTSRSTAAPLTVSGVLGGDVGFQINQQVAPSGYTQGGSQFNVIGVFRTTGTTLTVSWGSASSGTVAADAIHLVLADPGQEIQVVSDPGLDLADGGTLNLGATTLNSTLTKTFTISNQGTSNLVLAQSITLPPDYTITARTPATLFDGTNSTTIAPDGSPVSFTISVNTSTLGTKSGTISFGTDDPSENPFDFTISAIVNPTTVIIDNNGPYSPAPFSGVYSDTGNLSYFTNQGFLSDLREIASGATTRSATYTFNGLVDGGAYTVATTWTPFSNRSTAAPYAINQGSSTTTVTVNQQVAPNDFSDQGASWESLGVFRLSGTTTLVVTINGAASGNVIADAVRIERLFGPEIGVTYGSGTSVAVGDTVDMGSVGRGGTALSRTFTITNQGAENLTISGTLTPPTGFSLSGLSPGGLFGGGTTTLIPGATASFTVELSSTTQGSYSWPISFTTNDSDENPFAFTLTGTVTAPTATKQIIDNNGPTAPSPLAGTYTDSGNLGYWTGQGYLNDVREATTTNFATKSATYTFSGLTSGSTYSVAATWSAFSNRATNAPYTVSGVSGGPLTVLINQRIAPNDFSDEGGMWENLGAYVTSGTTLTVVLGGASTGSVIADAVRLEELIGPEIVVTSNSTNIAVGDTVALGQTLIGNPLRRTFTIQNVGVTAMDIGSSLTLPTGFTLVPASDLTNPPNPINLFSSPVVLGLGASAQFTLAVTTTSVASYSGIVSFTNSDANESPYSFTVTASVAGSAILDNGDAGTTNTGYTYYTSIGYNNDVHFAYNPSASIVSTWTFSGLAAGLYRVGATWVAHPNRATNASFTVSSSVGGGTATTAVNQRIAPTGILSGGFAFQDLVASFNHTGGNLVVTLTTLGADGYVIADAIRVAAPGTLLIDDKQARAAASANFVAGTDSLAGISIPSSTLLTRDDVIPYLDQAVNYWKKIDPQAASKLSQVEVIIDDLPGAVLGLGEFDYPTIWLDRDAAGYGWRLDRTGVSTEREQGRVDLLSVMVHELGHVLNLPDLDPVLHPTSVMAGVLPVGISRVERGSWNSLDSLSDSGVLPLRLVDDPLGRLSVAWSNSREGDRFSGELTGRLEDGLFSELAEDFQPGVSPFSEAVDSGEALAYDETRSRRRLQLTVDKTREEEERLVDEALAEWELSESDPQV